MDREQFRAAAHAVIDDSKFPIIEPAMSSSKSESS